MQADSGDRAGNSCLELEAAVELLEADEVGCVCELMLVWIWLGRERLMERDSKLMLGVATAEELGKRLTLPGADIVAYFEIEAEYSRLDGSCSPNAEREDCAATC
jgi:hypothetical protein